MYMSSNYLHIYLNCFGFMLGFVGLPFYILFSMIALGLLIFLVSSSASSYATKISFWHAQTLKFGDKERSRAGSLIYYCVDT
uniref:Uncharacterized protein n=1 Tax=Aegilops tauschii subsp. strangulata TaxID=200361 RepID=A0A453D6I2_AEGTS